MARQEKQPHSDPPDTPALSAFATSNASDTAAHRIQRASNEPTHLTTDSAHAKQAVLPAVLHFLPMPLPRKNALAWRLIDIAVKDYGVTRAHIGQLAKIERSHIAEFYQVRVRYRYQRLDRLQRALLQTYGPLYARRIETDFDGDPEEFLNDAVRQYQALRSQRRTAAQTRPNSPKLAKASANTRAKSHHIQTPKRTLTEPTSTAFPDLNSTLSGTL